MRVHTALGPGLLERVYQACLAQELVRIEGLHVEEQVGRPVNYGGTVVPFGYRIDMIVHHAVLVELKAVDTVLPVHHAQVVTYLKLTGLQVGLLLNLPVRTPCRASVSRRAAPIRSPASLPG